MFVNTTSTKILSHDYTSRLIEAYLSVLSPFRVKIV